MNKNLNNVLVRYLQLCEAFRDSDVWSEEAKQAIDLYKKGDKGIKRISPAMGVYIPLNNCSVLLDEINRGKFIDKQVYKDVYEYADAVWCGINNESSFRQYMVKNEPINCSLMLVGLLSQTFNLKESVVDIEYLSAISGCVMDELKEFI